MHTSRLAVALASALTLFAANTLPAATVTLTNVGDVPDFSQHNNVNWANYCAPTSAADLVYYFSQNGFTALRQANPIGPSAVADAGANSIVGGNVTIPPDPIPGSLADRMSTSTTAGTTPANLRQGLDDYLEANDGDASITWDTTLSFDSDFINGGAFYTFLQNQINDDNGVILLIDWQGPPPVTNDEQDYDLPAEPGTGSTQSLSHAVAMVSYDASLSQIGVHDPANNLSFGAGIHDWTATADVFTVTPTATTIEIASYNGALARVYGAVVTNPVPEPSSIVLLGIGIAGLLAGRRRRLMQR